MPLLPDALQHFKAESIRGARGYFRVGQTTTGQWWLIDPEDQPFFCRAVNGVSSAADSRYHPVSRVRGWGFNTLGARASPDCRGEGAPFVGTVKFSAIVPEIRANGVRLPDVFDPNWTDAAQQRAAEVCSEWLDRTDLLGWLMDDDLEWGEVKEQASPSFLQTCLSLEPSLAAYHAAWEFVLAPHGGVMSRLSKAWGWPMENKGVVRELTRSERGLTTVGHARDDARWTHEFAQRYLSTASAAIRTHDSNHLVVGVCDIGSGRRRMSGSTWLSEYHFPLVDIAWIQTRDIKSASPGPLFVGNFCWAGEQPALSPRARAPRLTTVERMLRHGRSSLRATIANPSVVGYAWEAWQDDPAEQPPFGRGLVHTNDVEAREHTELLTDLNSRIGMLRPFVAA